MALPEVQSVDASRSSRSISNDELDIDLSSTLTSCSNITPGYEHISNSLPTQSKRFQELYDGGTCKRTATFLSLPLISSRLSPALTDGNTAQGLGAVHFLIENRNPVTPVHFPIENRNPVTLLAALYRVSHKDVSFTTSLLLKFLVAPAPALHGRRSGGYAAAGLATLT